jgi:hypothetical protein
VATHSTVKKDNAAGEISLSGLFKNQMNIIFPAYNTYIYVIN